MTRDEVACVKAALAEVGYPLAKVWDDDGVQVQIWDRDHPEVCAPSDAVWTAFLIAGLDVRCWPCWNSFARGCEHDPWTSERPNLRRAS